MHITTKFNANRISKGMLYFVYRLILDYIYLYWVSPLYAYMGLTSQVTVGKVLISYLSLFLLVVMMPRENDRVWKMVLQLHFIVMIVPLTSLYAMANLSTKFLMMLLFCFVLQIILLRYLPLMKIPKIKGARQFLMLLFGGLTLVTYSYLLLTQRISIRAFDLINPLSYEIRATRFIHPIMGYLIPWQFRVINPALLVVSFVRRNYGLASIAIFMQALLFVMFPHKEVILSVVMLLLVLYMRERHKFSSYFTSVMSACNLVSLGIFKFTGNIALLFVFSVRFLYIPALIKFHHYDFFSVNTKLFYSEGLLGKLFGMTSPYPVTSGFLVQGAAFGNANTGYLAYGYDNLGFVGMVVMSTVFVILLLTIESLARRNTVGEVFALVLYPMIVLNDTDLLTSFFTGGLFLLLAFLLVFRADESFTAQKPHGHGFAVLRSLKQ